MTTRNEEGLFSCRNICWLVAAIFGIFIALIFYNWIGFGWFAAIILGIIGFVGARWILDGYICASTPNQQPDQISPRRATSNNGADNATDGGSSQPATAAPQPMASEMNAPMETVAEETAEETADQSDAAAANTTAASAANLPEGMAQAADSKPALYTSPPADADDLKMIKGVGPALEKTLNGLGVYTFAQIAKWSTDDIAWVDGNLKFKGRILRDDWVSQAKTLMSGGETAFSQKVEDGKVY
jgi:predicted flap endonuclease-1-like 5' DNA nuclease